MSGHRVADDRAAYRAIEDQVVALYTEGRYGDGVGLLRAAIPRLPSWRADLAHLAACLLGAAGRPAEALAELRSAFDAGAWWHRRILVDDDDLASLRDLPGFADLVERSHARALESGAAPRPPQVRRPAGAARGLLVALHGAGEDADDAVTSWSAAVTAGFVLVAPDSSQRNTPTYRSWPDPATGLRDLAAALAALPAGDQGLPLVAAGFSAGGRQAILWALAGEPGRPAGFIAVAPAIGPAHLDPTQVTAAVARGVTGTVLLGERDDDVRDDALPAIDGLHRAGLRCALDLIPGLGHAFPDDFPVRLHDALRTAAEQLP
jgi:dienelactone hydrolase